MKNDENIFIFHAGTDRKKQKIFSVGGRVLNFVSTSDEFIQSRKNAINLINKLNWSNGFFRSDIGYKIINK